SYWESLLLRTITREKFRWAFPVQSVLCGTVNPPLRMSRIRTFQHVDISSGRNGVSKSRTRVWPQRRRKTLHLTCISIAFGHCAVATTLHSCFRVPTKSASAYDGLLVSA